MGPQRLRYAKQVRLLVLRYSTQLPSVAKRLSGRMSQQSSPLDMRSVSVDTNTTGRPVSEKLLTEELHRFQAELQTQNEELRATQNRLEASRLEYFQLFEDSPIPMVVTDGRGWVIKMNNSARTMLGVANESIRRGPLIAWVDSEHHDRFNEHLRRARRQPTRVVTEVCLSGSTNHWTVRLVTDPFGHEQMLTAIVDITEIREAERARRQTESRYRRLFSASRDALFVIEANSTKIMDANRAAAEILRAPSEDALIGRSVYDYVPAEQRGAWRGLVASALDAREPAQVVELTFRSGYEELLAEVRLSQVDKEPPTLLVNIRDVRDRQKLLEERYALETRLSQVEKMEALGTLAGGVAHDMNNMLTAVRMAASSLVEELPENSNERDDAEAIMTACTRFSRLVENLLGFAKREPGTKRLARLSEVVREVSSLVESRIKRTGVRLETELELPNLQVEADPARLTQSLMNLVLNALDELPSVKESRITVRARRVNRESVPVPEEVEGSEFVCISVEDNGPGMPPKVKARAFDPFFTTKPEGRGTGLGLAVVYRNVRHFGGWVTIDSEVGQGTRVYMYIPRASIRPRHDSVNPMTEHRSQQPCVLVVEDEELVAKSVGRYLRRCGFAVRVAHNGREGVGLFEEVSPDVVLLDVVMPEMDGPTCARRLRQIRPDIPILFYSAHLREHGVDDLGLDNQTAFLEKPFEFNSLRQRLLRLMRSSGRARILTE